MRALFFPLALVACIVCAQDESNDSNGARVAAEASNLELTITDAFRISSGDIVIAGRISSGRISIGDEVCLISAATGTRRFKVAAMESFNRVVETADAGMNVGLMVDGEIDPDQIASGDLIKAECS